MQEPLLSIKLSFVKIGSVDWKLPGDNRKTNNGNMILEIESLNLKLSKDKPVKNTLAVKKEACTMLLYCNLSHAQLESPPLVSSYFYLDLCC